MTALDPRAVVVDLGSMPLANGLLQAHQLRQPEVHYPLRALVCQHCLLVQLPDTVEARTLFTDAYPFRSGLSATWRAHCEQLADLAIDRFRLHSNSRVLEIGSNDGAGLRRFRDRDIPAMGVEPSRIVAEEALQEGLATHIGCWTYEYAQRLRDEGYRADLVIARNVLAHVPDFIDFLEGVSIILAPGGVAVIETPHVGALIAQGQWDQVYHEHHCYFSLTALQGALKRVRLQVLDVESLPVHGGSLRVFVAAVRDNNLTSTARVREQLIAEADIGLRQPETYRNFQTRPALDRHRAWQMLTQGDRRPLVGYGASAKAATLLNYLGVRPDLIRCVVDTTPAKWGRYLPGSHIPICSPEWLARMQPKRIVNFCWNWREESERNLRAACPDAEILYLHDPGSRTWT